MMKLYKVFFDASVIFSAIYSKTGGSYKLASLAREEKIKAITTQTVIGEVKENSKKFSFKDIDTDLFIAKHNFLVREKVTEQETVPFIDKIHEKDAHVFAGAILTSCDYLVTLDKKHINKEDIKNKFPQLKIYSPKLMLEHLRQKKIIS